MAEFQDFAKLALFWLGPPLLWIVLFKTFPDFLGNNLLKIFEARRAADLERLKGEIARQNGAEIEALKAELQSISSTVKTSTDFLIAGQGELRSKTIAAAEALWTEMLRLREVYGSMIFMDTMLLKQELCDFITGKRRDNEYFQFNEFKDQHALAVQFKGEGDLDRARLFVGDRLWLIFFNYRSVLGRCGYLLSDSIARGRLRDWRADEHIRSMLLTVIAKETVDELLKLEHYGLERALAHINAAFLEEAARVMSGSSSFAASLTDVHSTLLLAAERLNERGAPDRQR